MRIIAGAWKGRRLLAPEGLGTRPTAIRARQALFDMLWHAPWAGRELVEGAVVLDAFAGTGAYGLEALSRGAAEATFLEKDRAALSALRANIAACAGAKARVLAVDATKPPRAATPCTLAFLDPPYGAGLLKPALDALDAAGWFAPGAIICTELGPKDEAPETRFPVLAERAHGKARLLVLGG
ncbi:16S rRNA (guanine(966)-N(2))-methyltransferase RsmD [Roseococcus thiosulfatophilus]|uniref:16S rRNA (guanine(966)-N(2))-methyltransferase RsmD n=1 Tax=Roseococcus thiosulfatophilus TaxID=35813 RepID=UPI001A8F5FBF|nr:16S rRNA (guanine(966)-N(2))-methyltransferase RsmD [Roseococcus thiosulfatophilus]